MMKEIKISAYDFDTNSTFQHYIVDIENNNLIPIKHVGKREDYHTYLQSYKWKRLRNRRVGYDKFTCQRCGKKILNRKGKGCNVHHLTYKNVATSKEFNDLRTVCTPCHLKIHNIREKERK